MSRMSKEDADGSKAYMRGLMRLSGGNNISTNVSNLIMWKIAVRTDQNQNEIY